MSYRALLVEDAHSWKEILTEILEDMAFAVSYASDYQSALTALKNGPYDLALLDISLKINDHDNQDGLRILEHLRTNEPNTPAIILTGYATVELAIEALSRLQANDFLRKEQFDRRLFQQTILQAIGSSAPATIGPSIDTPIFPYRPVGTPLDAHILVVEDNHAWQSIYIELLEEIGAKMTLAVSYGEARGLLQRNKFDMAVVDLHLISSTEPDTNRDGFHLLRLAHQNKLPTIVISALANPEAVDRAYEHHQIFAFLDKEGFQRTTFLQTLRDAMSYQPDPAPAIPKPLPIENSPLANLTERQLEVLGLLARGMTNREIAREIIVSVNTVKKHVLAIFTALGVNTRAAAAAIAARYGLGKD